MSCLIEFSSTLITLDSINNSDEVISLGVIPNDEVVRSLKFEAAGLVASDDFTRDSLELVFSKTFPVEKKIVKMNISGSVLTVKSDTDDTGSSYKFNDGGIYESVFELDKDNKVIKLKIRKV